MYKLCIDSGGTKIKYALFQNGYLILKDQIYYDGNLVNDTENVVGKFKQIINKLIDYNNISVLIGAAGALSIGEKRYEIQEDILTLENVCKCEIIADIALCAISNLKENDGIAVVLGTGSAFVKKINNEYSVVGGYGYILGDEASGYEYGHMLLKEYLRLKTKQMATSLTFKVERYFHTTNERDIVRKVMNSPREEVSKLCELFIDSDCSNYVTQQFIAKAIKLFLDVLHETKLTKLIIEGSLTKSIEFRKAIDRYEMIEIANEDMIYAVNYYEFN